MRWIIASILMATAVEMTAFSQEAGPATNAPTVAATPRSGTLSAEESARYLKFKIAEACLETQVKTLNELADDHQKRSEAARSEKLESEKWETALAQELRSRAVTVGRQLNQVATERVAFEESFVPPITAAVSPGALEPSGSLNPIELAYVIQLDKRLSTVTGEWLAALDNSRNYTLQLGTNRVPEETDRISALLNDSTRQARDLEKEQSDLELRKLEFRALRK